MEDELSDLFSSHWKLLADPSGGERLTDCFRGLENDQRIILAIGAEGGWTPYELKMFKERGFKIFAMGDRILRTDTACIALLGQLAERLTTE